MLTHTVTSSVEFTLIRAQVQSCQNSGEVVGYAFTMDSMNQKEMKPLLSSAYEGLESFL